MILKHIVRKVVLGGIRDLKRINGLKSGLKSKIAMVAKDPILSKALWFEKEVHWIWHHYHARVSSRQHFHGLRGKGFPTESLYSMGTEFCPSSSWHISVHIRSGIQTVFAFAWEETDSISVQLHVNIQVYRWRIVNQLSRFWESSWADVFRWAWDQRDEGDQHLCFLLGLPCR